MHDIEVKRHVDASALAAITGLLEAATDADAHPALGEHAWLDLVQGGRAGFAGLVAWERDHSHPVGYAQLNVGADEDGAHTEAQAEGAPAPSSTKSWSLEVVVDPHHRTPGNTVAIDLVRAATELIGSEGGGHVHLWVSQPGPYHYRLAQTAGLQPGRTLYQMRRSLPAEHHAGVRTRPFRPGYDEKAWLEVNNRAFEWHPEQGGWTEETLRARETQPWFDAAGFLLYERDDRLAGFCWTKIHGDASGHDHHHHDGGLGHGAGAAALGEIYVVAVDPDFGGQGLGRELTLAGLDYLATQDIAEAMLYVDAGNARAVGMYISLGFTVNHIDRAFTGDVAPSTNAAPGRGA